MVNLTETQIANRKAWIEALRSDKYKQTTGNLKIVSENSNAASYCCLGVAAECVMNLPISTEGSYNIHPNDTVVGFEYEGQTYQDFLPDPPFTDFFGLFYYIDDCEIYTYDQSSFSDMNDNSKYSFLKIADAIEKFTEEQIKNQELF